MSEKHIQAVLHAIRDLECSLCEPVAQNDILFRCLDADPVKQKSAVVELMSFGAHCLLSGAGEDKSMRLLRRLKRARKIMDSDTAPEGYEQIIQATGDKRQGSLPNTGTAPCKLVVLLKIRAFIEAHERLPKVGEIQQAVDWVSDESVRTVFQDLHDKSGVFFPSGREESGWRHRKK